MRIQLKIHLVFDNNQAFLLLTWKKIGTLFLRDILMVNCNCWITFSSFTKKDQKLFQKNKKNEQNTSHLQFKTVFGLGFFFLHRNQIQKHVNRLSNRLFFHFNLNQLNNRWKVFSSAVGWIAHSRSGTGRWI